MEFSKLNKKAVKSWIIKRAIFTSIFLIIYFVGLYVFLMPLIQDAGLQILLHIASAINTLILLTYTFGFPILEYKQWSYRILDDRVELRYGIIVRKKVILPISKLQYIDVLQGPIYKIFALSSVKLNTAGILTHVIPALTTAEAKEISQNLMNIINREANNE